MQEEEVIAFLGMVAGSTIVLVSFARAWVRRLEIKNRQRPPIAADERLDRLEQAVDAIAVEVERISEGQRFVTKLLTDRRADAPAIQPGDRVRG